MVGRDVGWFGQRRWVLAMPVKESSSVMKQVAGGGSLGLLCGCFESAS